MESIWPLYLKIELVCEKYQADNSYTNEKLILEIFAGSIFHQMESIWSLNVIQNNFCG